MTYALTGDDSEKFTIDGSIGDTRRDSEPGQIRVAAMAGLDHEATTPSYTLTVTATDPSTLSTTTEVTINVTDVDEAPEFAARFPNVTHCQ